MHGNKFVVISQNIYYPTYSLICQYVTDNVWNKNDINFGLVGLVQLQPTKVCSDTGSTNLIFVSRCLVNCL